MRAAWQAGYTEWYQAVYLPRMPLDEQRTSSARPSCARCANSWPLMRGPLALFKQLARLKKRRIRSEQLGPKRW
jgi:hypothetical protein